MLLHNRRIRQEVSAPFTYQNFNPHKGALIDYAFARFPIRSLADFGGVWNVDGAYTFYALDHFRPERAVLVDWRLPESVVTRAHEYPALELIEGYFSQREVLRRVGKVDAILLFDVLLHQVRPDWDDILERVSDLTDCILVYNQQWTGERTVRLLDLGEPEYFANVPHRPDERPYDDLFAKLDLAHPVHHRNWRDVHSIWQWGITDGDLIACLSNLGYKLYYQADWGRFDQLLRCANRAFVFARGCPRDGR